jgi:hypothetical protein
VTYSPHFPSAEKLVSHTEFLKEIIDDMWEKIREE